MLVLPLMIVMSAFSSDPLQITTPGVRPKAHDVRASFNQSWWWVLALRLLCGPHHQGPSFDHMSFRLGCRRARREGFMV